MDAVADVRPPARLEGATTKVLVVEDHEINIIVVVEMAKHVARDLGLVLEISVARTARDATAQWQNEAPDVVLLDLNLPDGRGDQVCRAMTEGARTNERPYVVCVTANAEEVGLKSLRASGVDDCIDKPLRAEALRACLKHWSERRSAAMRR